MELDIVKMAKDIPKTKEIKRRSGLVRKRRLWPSALF